MIRPPRPAFPSLLAAIALAASVPLESLVAQQADPSSGLDLAGMDRSVKRRLSPTPTAPGWAERVGRPHHGASAI
jgi:hypothetical protein